MKRNGYPAGRADSAWPCGKETRSEARNFYFDKFADLLTAKIACIPLMDALSLMGTKGPFSCPSVAMSVRTDRMFAIPFAINLGSVAVISRRCGILSCNQRADDPPMFAIPTADVCRSLHLRRQRKCPPSTSTGSGTATVSLDTAMHEITYDVTFSGFVSEVTAAHIHGPAEAGKNAGVVVPLGNNPTSPIHGTAKLTPEQEQQLTAGQYYVNVHTKNNPGGAIRGQLAAAK
jgi:CHRD domain